MNKTKRIFLISAGILVLLGVGISSAAIAMGAVNEESGTRETRSAGGEISSIIISADSDDIQIIGTDTDVITVSYTTGRTKQYDFSEEGGVLSLKSISRKRLDLRWTDYINLNFNGKLNQIIIELPKDSAPNIELSTDFGDIYASGVKGNMTLTADCGDIEVKACEPSLLICNLDYGDIELDNIYTDSVSIDNSCGDVEGKNISTGSVTAQLSMGDIELERLSADNINLKNDCGDIELSILGSESDYTIRSKTNLGSSNLTNRSGGDKTLDVSTDLGGIEIKFLR